MFLNIVKAIYDKDTVNNILNDERLKAFPLGSGKDMSAHYHHSYST